MFDTRFMNKLALMMMNPWLAALSAMAPPSQPPKVTGTPLPKPDSYTFNSPLGSATVRTGVNPIVDANLNVMNWWSTALLQGLMPTPAVAAKVWVDGLMGKSSVLYYIP
jgi:hypothetical protein